MIERCFVRRNRAVQLHELTDLVAVRAQATPDAPRLESTIPESVARQLSGSQVEAFEQAGWAFQEPSSRELPEDAPRAKVFVKPDGRLALSTNTLTVQLRDDPSKEEANALLDPYGCRVLEQLTFATGLFRVAVTDQAQGDALDVANQLMDSGLVEFAEPELIEEIGQRSP